MNTDQTMECLFAAHDSYSVENKSAHDVCEDRLDAALAASFPASDPIAVF
jgi:hypothetical protein